MNKNKEIILVFFIGLIVTLFLLEAVLRGYGIFYKSIRNSYKRGPVSKKGDKYVILCLGNSFTAGVGAPKGESYPDHLQRLFNKNTKEKDIVVVNRGMPGISSGELLYALEKNIFEANPDLIILQIGSRNFRNLNKYGAFLKRKNSALKDTGLLYKSRIFRLFIILIKGVKNRGFYRWLNREPLNKEYERFRRERLNKGKDKKIENDQSKLIVKIKDKLMGVIIRRQDNIEGFIWKLILMLHDVEDYPNSVYDTHKLKKEDIFLWVESDMREIVKIAQAREVKVLIQSYPLPLEKGPVGPFGITFLENIKNVNAILNKIAKEEKAPFVDNADLFTLEPLAASNDPRHPNSRGYEIIAGKIFEHLKGFCQ